MSNLKKFLTIGVTVMTVLWSVGVSLAPLGVSAAASAGDLIKMAGNSAVYYFDGSKRYVFPNEATYMSWYKDFSGVKTIPASELQTYAIGGNVTIRPGTKLVKITTDPKVYAISHGGTLHGIDSEARALKLYGSNWNKMIVDVSDAFFVNYKTGSAISSDMHVNGTLIKYSGSSTYYLVEDGKKRPFASDAALAANMINTANAVVTDVTYSDGTSLTGKEATVTNVAGSSTGSYVPGQGTGLSVALASDTPASATLADGSANNAVLKLNFTAGNDGPVSVTGLKVTKGGYTGNTNITGVAVYDAAGKRHGNVVTTLGSDGVATLTFVNDPIVVSTGSTTFAIIKINLSSSANSGTLDFSVKSASDVSTASTATVSGTFPAMGNTMTTVDGSSSLATVTLDAQPINASGVTLNVDSESSQDIAKFRIAETTSNEAVKVYGLNLWNNGNASASSDYKDVQLVSQDGTVLATAQPSGQYVMFDLSTNPYLIDKGQTKDFTIRTKIIDGASRTIQFVVYENYDLDIRGLSSGAGLLPGAGSNDTSFPIGDATNYNKVTIGSGSAIFGRASDSPSDAVTPGASDVVIGKYYIKSTGEDMELRAISFGLDQDTSSIALTGTVYVKVDGNTVYSAAANTTNFPVNGTASSRSLSSYPIIKAGVMSYITVSASISSSATSSDAYFVNDFDVTSVKRLITNDIVDPSITATDSNTRSVKAAAVTVNTLSTPVAGSMVLNTNNVEFAKFELNAQNSGESVRVTSLTVTDTKGAGAAYTDVANLVMYDSQGNSLQTSSSTSTNAATVAFNFTTPILVTQSTPVILTLKGDWIAGTAGSTSTHTFNVNSTSHVSANGKDTGNTIGTSNVTINGSGQAMTLVSGGTLTGSLVTGSGATPSVAQVFNVGTANSTFLAVRFTTQYEAQKITTLKLEAAGTALTQNNVRNIKLYEQIGNGTISATPFATTSQFTTCSSNACSNTWTATDNLLSAAIQPGTPVTIYVKADIGSEGIAKLGNDFYMHLNVDGTNVIAKGITSSAAPGTYTGGNLNASGAVTRIVPFGVVVSAFEPTSSVTQTVVAGTAIGRFKVQNNGNAQITLTNVKFTDSGTHTGTDARYTIYASSENSGDYTTNSLEVSATDTLDFAALTASTAINGGAYRYLTVTLSTATSVVSGDSFALSVASLGDLKYSVTEAGLGYDGTQDGDLADTITSLYVDGKPTLGTMSKQ
ncbi:hypothetical protein KKC17_00465 [Patescibacteria group bacterium]|nr:hypothetical protein [Patescibacteria group bacterium]